MSRILRYNTCVMRSKIQRTPTGLEVTSEKEVGEIAQKYKVVESSFAPKSAS